MGNRKKRTGGTTADRGAPTMRMQHKHDRSLTFWEKFRSFTTDLLRLQGDGTLNERRRRGWTRDYPDGKVGSVLLPAKVHAKARARHWARVPTKVPVKVCEKGGEPMAPWAQK